MKSLRTLLAGSAVATAALLASTSASAVVIGFEELGNVGLTGPAITNQYAADGVTFSSSGGETNLVSSQAGIGDGLNFLCTGTGSIDCSHDTLLTFTGGVSGLTFLAVGSNDAGVQAKVDVYVGGAFAATQDITVSGNFNTPDLVDLGAYGDVTSIRIHDITDGGGLGWDDFSFTTSAVPEPGSVAMLLAGLGGLAFARRQRRA